MSRGDRSRSADAAGVAAEPRESFLSSDEVRLHYVEWGEPRRPPLLLVHGGSAHARWWDFCVPRLADRFHVIAVDLRGHGDSGWPTDGRYGLDTHAGDVRSLIEALHLSNVVLVGHSFGGLVAVRVAAEVGERIAHLVLVDTRVKVSERAARFMDALRRLPHPSYASVEEAIDRFRLLPADNGAAPEVLSHVARHAIRRREDGRWTLKFDRRAIASTRPCDLSSVLAGLRAPVLVVRGSESQLMSPAAVQEIAAAAPHARIVEIPAAHHHVMLDQPLLFAETLRGILPD